MVLFSGKSCKGAVNLTDRIDDIVIDTLGVFRTDAYLDETVEYIQRLAATVRTIFDFLPFRTVK